MEENSVIREAMPFAVVQKLLAKQIAQKQNRARCRLAHFAFDRGGVPAPLPLFLLGRLF